METNPKVGEVPTVIIINGYRIETDEELYHALQLFFLNIDSDSGLRNNPSIIDTESLPRFRKPSNFEELLNTVAKNRYQQLLKECKVRGLKPYRRLSKYCFAMVAVSNLAPHEFKLLVLLRDVVSVFKTPDVKEALRALHDNLEAFVKEAVRERFNRCSKCNRPMAYREKDDNFCPRCGLKFEEHYRRVVFGVRET